MYIDRRVFLTKPRRRQEVIDLLSQVPALPIEGYSARTMTPYSGKAFGRPVIWEETFERFEDRDRAHAERAAQYPEIEAWWEAWYDALEDASHDLSLFWVEHDVAAPGEAGPWVMQLTYDIRQDATGRAFELLKERPLPSIPGCGYRVLRPLTGARALHYPVVEYRVPSIDAYYGYLTSRMDDEATVAWFRKWQEVTLGAAVHHWFKIV